MKIIIELDEKESEAFTNFYWEALNIYTPAEIVKSIILEEVEP